MQPGCVDLFFTHEVQSFKQEYRERLEKHNINYDERVLPVSPLQGLDVWEIVDPGFTPWAALCYPFRVKVAA
ncbi:MAG: hypothetical protein WD625_04065 [Balneolales bacterium]